MPALVTDLKAKGVLHSPEVVRAFSEVDRADFVPQDAKRLAAKDVALSTGCGTAMQPYMIAFMLEQLHIRPGDTVLEIGCGPAWKTALMAHIVGPAGKVYALELSLTCCNEGAAHLAAYPLLMRRVTFVRANLKEGYPQAAPFDRIVVGAEMDEDPQALREQLLPGGRLLYPARGSLVLETKDAAGSCHRKEFAGFVFSRFV